MAAMFLPCRNKLTNTYYFMVSGVESFQKNKQEITQNSSSKNYRTFHMYSSSEIFKFQYSSLSTWLPPFSSFKFQASIFKHQKWMVYLIVKNIYGKVYNCFNGLGDTWRYPQEIQAFQAKMQSHINFDGPLWNKTECQKARLLLLCASNKGLEMYIAMWEN